jgi:hypothetical protein
MEMIEALRQIGNLDRAPQPAAPRPDFLRCYAGASRLISRSRRQISRTPFQTGAIEPSPLVQS